MKFRAGDWVEIRGKEEILGSLDKNGRLEEFPLRRKCWRSADIGSRSRLERTRVAIPSTPSPIDGSRMRYI